ncbi:MAG: glutamate 5-kinase [Planctomycetota bacterium]
MSPAPEFSSEPPVVVKVGSAIVAPRGHLDHERVSGLAAEMAELYRSEKRRVVLVSSGAVACGLRAMRFRGMPEKIADRQAAAAAGQPALIAAWARGFGAHGLDVAQVLLTADDIDFRARFVNAHRTLMSLLDAGVVPVVNENDSVAFDEIQLGDNDRLSALVAGLVGAGTLVILSTAPGLCEGGVGGEVIREVRDIDEARANVDSARSATGVGGMATKLDAAASARAMGITTVVCSGDEPDAIRRALSDDHAGTVFRAEGAAVASARKRWIAHKIRTKGTLVVDGGAKAALEDKGASLLPKGIVGVEGDAFDAGAAVDIATDEVVFARGLVSYRRDEIEKIMGRPSSSIAEVLGYTTCDEVVHRDNLVVFDRAERTRRGGLEGSGQ